MARYLDVVYAKQSESQKIDIYLPEDGEGHFRLSFLYTVEPFVCVTRVTIK